MRLRIKTYFKGNFNFTNQILQINDFLLQNRENWLPSRNRDTGVYVTEDFSRIFYYFIFMFICLVLFCRVLSFIIFE